MSEKRIRRGVIASLFFAFSLIIFSCSPDDKARIAFEKAESHRTEGRYADAISLYRDIAVQYGKSELAPESLFRMGEISYIYKRDPGLATEVFRQLINDYPSSERVKKVQPWLADLTMSSLGDYKQAIVEYQRAILYYKGEKEVERFQFEIARAYFNLKNFQQQRLELELLLSRYPETELRPDVYYEMANSYYVEGFTEKAIEYYKKLLGEFPDTLLSLEAYFRLASCLEEKEDLLGAVEMLKEIESVYPNRDIVRMRIERIKKRLKSRRR